jgi:L-2-hydroxyglutarate oxidase LhgO
LADAEAHGAVVAFESPLDRAESTGDGILLEIGGAEPTCLLAKRVVNSAGLHAPALARQVLGRNSSGLPRSYFCKGNYYGLIGGSPFSRLIYPVPEHAGLGVHATIDLAGRCRFGPDTEWVDGISFAVDPGRADAFYAEVRKYWPELPDGALVPDYSGIRPKLGPPGSPPQDFLILGPAENGVPGLVELFGIESPGLTASWPIACETARRLGLPETDDDIA